MVVSTANACIKVIRGKDPGQVKAGGSAAHDMLTLFKIEKQLAIEPIHQRGGAEGPGRLGNNKRQHLAAFKTGEQPQGNGHRRIKVCAGDTGRQVDGHGDAKAPDNTDLPLTKAGPGDPQRSDAARAEENEQSGAKKLGHALPG